MVGGWWGSTEGVSVHRQCIINSVFHRCTIIPDLTTRVRHQDHYNPLSTPHHKYTCTIKGNTGFLSLQHWKLLKWEALGFHWALSTCRKKAELLANALLIKLWCLPSPCRSWASLLVSPPSPAWQCSACSSNYPQPYLCFISLEWVFCALFMKANVLASEWPPST